MSLLAGVVGTAIGAVAMIAIKTHNRVSMSAILSFTAGFMLAMVCFDMLPEAVEHAGLVAVLPCAGLGVAIVWGLGRLLNVPMRRYLKDEGGAGRMRAAAMLLILAIGLHNFPEGMAIGAFDGASRRIAFALLIAVHNVPEGMAICAMLRRGGVRNGAAVAWSVLAGLPTVLGAIVGYWVSGISAIFTGICLALAAGAMLFVVFQDMFAESYENGEKNWNAITAIFGILLGYGVISMIAHG